MRGPSRARAREPLRSTTLPSLSMMNFAAKFHETSPGCAAASSTRGWVFEAVDVDLVHHVHAGTLEVEPVLDELLDLGVAAGFLATELVAGEADDLRRGGMGRTEVGRGR